MADEIAVIIRFSGETTDLLERFEHARRNWIEAQDSSYRPPTFYAACKTDEGIAVLTAWESAVAHRAFGEQMHGHIDAIGMGKPDRIERMRISKAGWDCPVMRWRTNT